MYNKGNNKAVIRSLSNKAEKGVLKKDELLIFEKALQGDLLNELKLLNANLASDKFEDWKEGFSHLDKLEEQQKDYHNFPQVNISEMDFVDILYWDQAFSDKLYTHHVSSYNEYYEQYLETDDKNYVINAFYELEKVAFFERGTLNTDSLLNVFADQGKRSFEVKFYDRASSSWEFRQFKEELLLTSNQWSDFEAKDSFDYTINITLKNLDKDNNYTQSQRLYTNEEITGYNAQTDQNGEIVQIPIVELYTARVNETAFTYVVNTTVEVEIVSNITSERVAYNNFSDRIYDERLEAYLINGDLRAIPPSVRLSNGNAFTSSSQYDYSLIIEELLRDVGDQIEDYVEQY